MKYAIINKATKEFYPDPIYEDIKRAKKKIDYLKNYRIQHDMEFVEYDLEKLSKQREAQHNKEWQRWISLID